MNTIKSIQYVRESNGKVHIKLIWLHVKRSFMKVFPHDKCFCVQETGRLISRPTIIKAMSDIIWQYIHLIKLQADVGSIKCTIGSEGRRVSN